MSITTKTAWINPQLACWNGDLDDWAKALTCSLRCSGADRMDVVSNSHFGPVTLAYPGTHTISIPSTNEWVYLIVKCIGSAMIYTTGHDYAGSSISGQTPLFGTTYFPAFALISTQNISAASIGSEAANTTIECMMLNVVLPTDSRLTT